MANRFPLIFNSGAGQIQELAASDNLDLTSSNLVNAGILFTSSGSATAPSLQIGSGTTYNPGLYSPGTDQLAISTNGVQRINIEADGDINIAGGGVFYDATNNRLAIGTTGPSNQLTIASNTLSVITLDWTGDNLPKATFSANHATGEVRMGATNNSGTYFTTLYSNNAERARIRADGTFEIKGAGTAGTSPGFSVNPSTPANSFVIDSSGRLGIGSSSPNSVLDVNVTSNNSSIFEVARFAANNSGTTNLRVLVGQSNTDTTLRRVAIDASRSDANVAPIDFTQTTSGGTLTRMRIDSSGRLLVGTSTARSNINHRGSTGVAPNVQFETATASYSGGLSIINNSTSGFAATLTLATSKGGGIGSNTIVGANEQTGTISFSASDGTNFIDCAQVRAEIDGTPGANDMPGRLVFSTTSDSASSPTPRMTIKNNGNVGVGVTGPERVLEVQSSTSNINYVRLREISGNTPTNGGSMLELFGTRSNGTVGFYGGIFGGRLNAAANNQGYLAFYVDASASDGTSIEEKARIDSSGRFSIGIIASPANQLQLSTDSAGKPSTNTWTIVSDERIKEEIELADLDLCYEAVKNIPLKRFKWKDEVYTEEQVRDRRKLGWIAQDVEAVFPKAVGTYEFKYNQVFEETIIPAVKEELDGEGNVTTPAQPERIEKGELISEDVIEDCRDLNSDQLYAAMYGAIQKLMIKVEALETEVAALKAS